MFRGDIRSLLCAKVEVLNSGYRHLGFLCRLTGFRLMKSPSQGCHRCLLGNTIWLQTQPHGVQLSLYPKPSQLVRAIGHTLELSLASLCQMLSPKVTNQFGAEDCGISGISISDLSRTHETLKSSWTPLSVVCPPTSTTTLATPLATLRLTRCRAERSTTKSLCTLLP